MDSKSFYRSLQMLFAQRLSSDSSAETSHAEKQRDNPCRSGNELKTSTGPPNSATPDISKRSRPSWSSTFSRSFAAMHSQQRQESAAPKKQKVVRSSVVSGSPIQQPEPHYSCVDSKQYTGIHQWQHQGAEPGTNTDARFIRSNLQSGVSVSAPPTSSDDETDQNCMPEISSTSHYGPPTKSNSDCSVEHFTQNDDEREDITIEFSEGIVVTPTCSDEETDQNHMHETSPTSQQILKGPDTTSSECQENVKNTLNGVYRNSLEPEGCLDIVPWRPYVSQEQATTAIVLYRKQSERGPKRAVCEDLVKWCPSCSRSEVEQNDEVTALLIYKLPQENSELTKPCASVLLLSDSAHPKASVSEMGETNAPSLPDTVSSEIAVFIASETTIFIPHVVLTSRVADDMSSSSEDGGQVGEQTGTEAPMSWALVRYTGEFNNTTEGRLLQDLTPSETALVCSVRATETSTDADTGMEKANSFMDARPARKLNQQTESQPHTENDVLVDVTKRESQTCDTLGINVPTRMPMPTESVRVFQEETRVSFVDTETEADISSAVDSGSEGTPQPEHTVIGKVGITPTSKEVREHDATPSSLEGVKRRLHYGGMSLPVNIVENDTMERPSSKF
eukprot:gb/GECG01014832.1/.p1 GENE.gb/GECG01014832.1/~~gb/GECG01014832.1/.p1  ORF type:complete len:620 (+),score=92.60 gb/GECG01014832.1/:1-1860(+)